MKLYLSSYKLGEKKDILGKWAKEKDNKIVLITNSRDIYEESERKAQGIARDAKALEELGFDVIQISLKEYFGKPELLRKEFLKYHAFFAIGGNTFALRKAMQLSGFDKFLKDILNNSDYLYGGYSAGICVLAPSLHGLELVDEPVNPYNEEPALFEGIGILDYVPVSHYKSEHPESEMIENVVDYLEKNKIKYKTLHDGDVIIEEINT